MLLLVSCISTVYFRKVVWKYGWKQWCCGSGIAGADTHKCVVSEDCLLQPIPCTKGNIYPRGVTVLFSCSAAFIHFTQRRGQSWRSLLSTNPCSGFLSLRDVLLHHARTPLQRLLWMSPSQSPGEGLMFGFGLFWAASWSAAFAELSFHSCNSVILAQLKLRRPRNLWLNKLLLHVDHCPLPSWGCPWSCHLHT